MKESTRVLVALGLGLGGGAAVAASGSGALLSAANAVAPIGQLWINAIRMTVIPLVVSLLITGIASAADLRSVGRLGGRTLLTFGAMIAGLAAIVIPVTALGFRLLPDGARPPLPPGAEEAARQLAADPAPPALIEWVVSLIPTNPIAAAASGTMVPLIVFALLLGLAITRTPEASRETLSSFFRALADAMLVLVRWIVAVAPVGIFCLVFPLAARGGLATAGAVGFYVVAYSIGCVVSVLLLYPVVAALGGISMKRFARAALPPQLIAFSTSSSVASLPALVAAAERDLGLTKRTAGFVLPLAVSLFKLAAPVSWTFGALFIAWLYGVPLGIVELATIGFAAVFLAFASPGVPRGAFLMLTPLFLAIGLPAEGIGILIAVDAIPDIFATVLNVTGDLAAAVIVDRRSAGDPFDGA